MCWAAVFHVPRGKERTALRCARYVHTHTHKHAIYECSGTRWDWKQIPSSGDAVSGFGSRWKTFWEKNARRARALVVWAYEGKQIIRKQMRHNRMHTLLKRSSLDEVMRLISGLPLWPPAWHRSVRGEQESDENENFSRGCYHFFVSMQ